MAGSTSASEAEVRLTKQMPDPDPSRISVDPGAATGEPLGGSRGPAETGRPRHRFVRTSVGAVGAFGARAEQVEAVRLGPEPGPGCELADGIRESLSTPRGASKSSTAPQLTHTRW